MRARLEAFWFGLLRLPVTKPWLAFSIHHHPFFPYPKKVLGLAWLGLANCSSFSSFACSAWIQKCFLKKPFWGCYFRGEKSLSEAHLLSDNGGPAPALSFHTQSKTKQNRTKPHTILILLEHVSYNRDQQKINKFVNTLYYSGLLFGITLHLCMMLNALPALIFVEEDSKRTIKIC